MFLYTLKQLCMSPALFMAKLTISFEQKLFFHMTGTSQPLIALELISESGQRQSINFSKKKVHLHITLWQHSSILRHHTVCYGDIMIT